MLEPGGGEVNEQPETVPFWAPTAEVAHPERAFTLTTLEPVLSWVPQAVTP